MRHALKPEWIKAENLEMTDLVRHKVWERVLRSSLQSYDKVFEVFATRFHYKVKHKRGKFDKLKVRLVIQDQHMRRKDATGIGDYTDAFSPVTHASGLRILLVIATENDMFTDHVDISQAFTPGDLQSGDAYMGNVYISAPPGFPEDPEYCYRLLKPLYGIPGVARAWFQTMSAFLKQEGCSKVGYEESMWKTTVNGLDAFRSRLLDHFDGSYEGEIQTYLGCEIERDIAKGTTSLSQKHYAEEVLRTYNAWDYHPSVTVLPPNRRLRKEDCDLTPDPAFHSRYHGIVASLGYLVNMTRTDLAFAYSELSNYVQFPGKLHMTVTEHVLRYLRGTYDKGILFSRGVKNRNLLWG
jgi:hypothetical protein